MRDMAGGNAFAWMPFLFLSLSKLASLLMSSKRLQSHFLSRAVGIGGLTRSWYFTSCSGSGAWNAEQYPSEDSNSRHRIQSHGDSHLHNRRRRQRLRPWENL